jgi:MIP family channel proteins
MGNTPKAFVAELVATFTLTFIGAGAIISNNMGGDFGILGIAIAHGLALALMVSATMGVSGGHVNPAVTFGFIVSGRIKPLTGLIYIVAQVIGAIVAAYLLRAIFPSSAYDSVHLGATTLSDGIGQGIGLLVEIILTFFLVFAVFGTAVDERGPKVGGFGIGLVLTMDILAGGTLTGASMNPARSFGPVLASGYWVGHWIYWVGPLVGGGLAALLYNSFLIKK